MADSTSKKTRGSGAANKGKAAAKPAAKVTAKPAAAKAAAPKKAATSAAAPAAVAAAAKPAVESPSATLRFKPDWQLSLEGALKTGGKLTIEYAPERAQLRKSAWGVQAFMRFLPGGEIREAAAVMAAKAAPVTVQVPGEATEVEVWFRNYAGTESSWDSNFGHNYRFRVER